MTSSNGNIFSVTAGNSAVIGKFPVQRPMTRSVDVFVDLRLNKRLSKQSWGWWFEMPSRSLWRHRYDLGSMCHYLYFPDLIVCAGVYSSLFIAVLPSRWDVWRIIPVWSQHYYKETCFRCFHNWSGSVIKNQCAARFCKTALCVILMTSAEQQLYINIKLKYLRVWLLECLTHPYGSVLCGSSIGSDNRFSHIYHQAFTWKDDDSWIIGPSETNLNDFESKYENCFYSSSI